MLHFSNEPIAP